MKNFITAFLILLSTYGLSQDRIGINTNTAGSTLSVNGESAIGSNYSSLTAPTNGVIIEGNVGIGTSVPAKILDVNGDARINGLIVGKGSGNTIYNTVVGDSALFSNSTGFVNTAIGSFALHKNTTATDNVGLGSFSLYNNAVGSNNTAVGTYSLANTTGGNNAAFGKNSLYTNTSGSNNTALGCFADVTANNLSNATAIGYNAKVAASNSMVLGGTGANAVNVGIGTTTPAQRLDVNGKIQMRTGATAGYVPVSDANGTMTWTNPATLSITETDPQVSSATTNNIPKWNGTTLIDGSIFDNGNVGIGTTAPLQKLHVNAGDALFTGAPGTTSGIEIIPINDVGNGGGRLFFREDNNDFFGISMGYNGGNSGNEILNWSANSFNITSHSNSAIGTIAFTILRAGGNVGIATSDPTQALDVNGQIRMRTGATAGYVPVSDANGTMTWTNPTSLISETDPQVSSSTTNKVPKWNGTTLTDGTLFDNGNVGIGTTAPNSQLHIDNPSNVGPQITLSAPLGGTPGIAFRPYQSAAQWSNPAQALISATDNNYSADIHFWTKDPGALANALLERITILNNGNVGIGNSNPAALLDVNGDAKINSLNIGRGAGNYTSNTVLGRNALRINTTGTFNTALGAQVLYSNLTGSNNTGIGIGALQDNTDGAKNTAVGVAVLNNNISGADNTGGGYYALFNSTGSGNTGFGEQALYSNVSGSNNTALGYLSGVSSGSLSNATAIGYNAKVSASNSLVLGGTGADAVNVGIGTTTPATALHVVDNSTAYATFVATIQNTANSYAAQGLMIKAGEDSHTSNSQLIRFSTPNGTTIGAVVQNNTSSIAYNTTSDRRLKTNINPTKVGLTDLMNIPVYDYEYKSDPGKTQLGFVAQELYNVLPSVVTVGGEDAKTEPWMVDYSKLTPLLVKALQDLTKKVDEQQKIIEELRRK